MQFLRLAITFMEDLKLETTDVEIIGLFGSDVQLVIPLFQRHYVWDREEQWEPLWEDIEKKALHRLTESQRLPTHFTGTIVVQLKQTNVNEAKKYEIIDGQQRITTFQVVLCALRDICILCEFENIKAEIERYVINQGILLDDAGNEKYKLIPTEFDRDSFIALVEGQIDNSSGQIRSTYNYFKKKIDDFVKHDRENMLALFHCVLNDFGFIQIRLKVGDEPERIFESLNARAKSLLQFDLLRNNLFLRARIEEDRDRLYEEYWKHFESPYWEKKVKIAQRKGALSELFFQHFLMAKLGEEKVTPLFNVYQKKLAQNVGVEHELSELNRYSEVYQQMTDNSSNGEIGKAMTFYKTFDITSLHPFILFLINELRLSGSDLAVVLHILESYTMRRVLCIPSSAARNYTKLFSRLIRRLKVTDFDLGNFIKLLYDENADSTRWPTDSDVEVVLTMPRFTLNRTVIRYVLYRIEIMMRSKNDLLEQHVLDVKQQLSLEHIMPEGWQNTWSLPLATDENGNPLFDCGARISYKKLFHSEYRENNPEWETEPSDEGLVDETYKSALSVANGRGEVLQNIGNLTLVTGPLNSRLSNKPFSEKKVGLFENSLLVLNKDICRHDDWDIPQINRRATELVNYFVSIWPSAESFTESVGEPL